MVKGVGIMYVCMYVCIYVCMYVCMYVFMGCDGVHDEYKQVKTGEGRGVKFFPFTGIKGACTQNEPPANKQFLKLRFHEHWGKYTRPLYGVITHMCDCYSAQTSMRKPTITSSLFNQGLSISRQAKHLFLPS